MAMAKLAIEFNELSLHVGGPGTRERTDLDVVVFESGLASKLTYQLRTRRDEPPHDVELPAASDLARQRLTAQSFVSDSAKDPGEVAAELRAVVVPTTH
jgi:hypothetical protein